ncbi:MAG: ABC transporter ATP-binding protein [Clostridia bacterium]|nr:ABC transporter ATP-binding protein [Clostridia bacterium]
MIKLHNVCAGYGGREVLHGVDLEAEKGQVTTIIGVNGCGKSTLLKTIMGFVPISGGDITVDGRSIKNMTEQELAREIAYLSQGKNVPDISAGRMVLHGRFPYLSYPRKYRRSDYEAAAEAMSQMGISDLSDRMMTELSGGMRQKVYIAMALAQQSPVILMDEPTTYLDIGQQLRFASTARELADSGKTVILVLHDILLALKISDRIAAVKEGRVVRCGTPREILDSGITQELYGVKIGVVNEGGAEQYYYNM